MASGSATIPTITPATTSRENCRRAYPRRRIATSFGSRRVGAASGDVPTPPSVMSLWLRSSIIARSSTLSSRRRALATDLLEEVAHADEVVVEDVARDVEKPKDLRIDDRVVDVRPHLSRSHDVLV